MRHSYTAWPEIVLIDGTYGLLDCNLTVMVMIVEDSNCSSEIAAVGLLAVEDEATVEWFISTFKENNGSVCTKTRCFMSDKDHTGRKVIKKIFYDSEKGTSPPVYICLFHTLQTFRRNITNISKEEMVKILTFVQRLAYSESKEEYDKVYKEFRKEVPSDVLDYYNDNWHGIIEEWVVFSMVEGNLMNRTNNRVESINQKLKQVIQKRSSLLEFLRSFFVYCDSHTNEIDSKAAKMFMKSKVYIKRGSILEKYSNFLTDGAFEHISDEIKRHEYVNITHVCEDGCLIERRGTTLQVTKDFCSCTTSASSLLPCRHLFAVRKSLDLSLYEERLCNMRWTKEYYKRTQRIFRVKTAGEIGERLPLICDMGFPNLRF
ncbi:protein FAR-RED IMPAIRED RESPONSE 1-like [Rhagoletis pomonella]|uniref:protein FAR-RED IMPAIRED RESPONSE 1-like n=1 Tax=Rhagoletis pomonella TaxID=28610 RepID=UPI00177C1003|nr:protein FAR-RED IMPAIRED RESPONSE 1-like [Rhagoletis pomonella]